MSIYDLEPFDMSALKTYPLASRPSKVSVADFATPYAGGSFSAFLSSLPKVLAAVELLELARRVREARSKDRPVVVGLGGHVIKTGCGPILIDLLERNIVTAFAMNGSCLVHDFEIAVNGGTSEDVDATLGSGQFGAAEETGRFLNDAAKAGAADRIGLGEAVGRAIASVSPAHASSSILHEAYRARIPVTVHVALGNDIPHIHPNVDGASLGATSMRDFQLLCSVVAGLDDGGVYLNLGSAVILPEVFLKAVTVVRNRQRLEGFTTANFDFIQHYRPLTNVVRRPTAGTGRGFALTGHHELMIPLFAAAVLDEP
ncbi:MAG: hypothetical protein IT175_04885 [Acidobacteria bacterium]|nr:hypothetical protein [Acidobacteriota bacterium]